MVSPLLRVEGLAKRFPNGTVALAGVDLAVTPGRVHGLLGANGAGKSTLIKMLAGALAPSGGRLLWRGEPVRWRAPIDAKRAGVATLHQHVPLVPTLTVAENILLDRGGWRRRRPGDRRHVAALIARTGARLDPDATVADLGIGDRQMVAILQALAGGADLVVMDEPTASLGTAERQLVYRIVRHLARDQGKAVLFVSHFLDEVMALTDEVTVLRDGRAALHAETATQDEARLAAAIAGRAVTVPARDPFAAIGNQPLLCVQGLASPGRLRPMSFDVAAGEVVGVAGLLGSGRSSLLHALFGADPHATGRVRFGGQAVGRSPAEAVAAGFALVPEDRTAQGLFPQLPLWQNISLPHLSAQAAGRWFPRRHAERTAAAHAIRRLGIKTPGPDALPGELSGGNAQKVTIARWLSPATRLLLLDEPSAGIDVGARTDIWRLVRDLAAGGLPVLVASSDPAELLQLCDRILVLRDGALVADRPAATLDEHGIVLLAGGTPARSAA